MEVDRSLLHRIQWIAGILSRKTGTLTSADLFAGLYLEAKPQICSWWNTEKHLDSFAAACRVAEYGSLLDQTTTTGEEFLELRRQELRESGKPDSGLAFMVELDCSPQAERIIAHAEDFAKRSGKIEPEDILAGLLLDPDFRLDLENSGMDVARFQRQYGSLQID